MEKEKKFEILLVDDNTADIELTKEVLEESGINTVFHAFTGAEKAMRFLKKQGEYGCVPEPDIIMIDINIPGENGLDLLEKIKTDETIKHIPVFMLTASEEKKDINRAYKLHANCYITKPAGFEEFLKIVKRIKEFWFETIKLPGENV
ncbi:MAG: response regulator [Candidatus Goldiibacteriota bacterium]